MPDSHSDISCGDSNSRDRRFLPSCRSIPTSGITILERESFLQLLESHVPYEVACVSAFLAGHLPAARRGISARNLLSRHRCCSRAVSWHGKDGELSRARPEAASDVGTSRCEPRTVGARESHPAKRKSGEPELALTMPGPLGQRTGLALALSRQVSRTGAGTATRMGWRG